MSEIGERPPVGLREDACLSRLGRIPLRGQMTVVILVVALAVMFDLVDQQSLAYVAPSMREQLGFAVGDIAFLASASFLGMVVGAGLGGRIADRIGRIRVCLWSLLLGSLGTLTLALLDTVAFFTLMRFLTGIPLGALYVVALTYLIEVSPPDNRNRRTAIVAFAGTCVGLLVSLVARIVVPLGTDGWRLVFVFGGLGLLLAIPLRMLPESPLWLLSRGRTADAEAALSRLEGGRAVMPAAVAPETASASATDAVPEPAPEPAPAGFRDLLRGGLLIPTLLLSALWILFQFGGQTFSVWLPTILQLRGFTSEDLLTIALIGTIGAPVGALTVIIAARFVPRWAMMVTTAGIAMLAAVIFGTTSVAPMLSTAAFLLFFASGVFTPLVATAAAEEYPTTLRASGSGITFSAGRLTNVISPFLVAAVLGAASAGPVAWLLLGSWGLVAAVSAALRFRPTARARLRAATSPPVEQRPAPQRD